MIPIWKDTEITISTLKDAVWTRIRKGGSSGDIIFTGRAVKVGGGVIAVQMNGVCSDYLSDALPLIDESEQAYTGNEPVTFVLEYEEGDGAWKTAGGVQFYPNWSYDRTFREKEGAVTMGPSRDVSPGQYLLITVMAAPGTMPEASAITLTGKRKDGTAYTKTVSVPAGSMMGTGVFTLPEFASPGDVLEVAGLTFRVTDACRRYVLHWFSDYGGWEQMLVENGAPQSDAVTRHTVQTGKANGGDYGNDRAIRNYANATERTLRLGTGWLSDAGSLQMRGLFNSTNVLLYDTQTDIWTPLVLTGDTVEYKTFKGNGGQMVRYDFEARVALNFVRR